MKAISSASAKSDEVLTTELAAERLGLSVRRLRELAQLGRIERHRQVDPVTKREATFFRAADVDRLRAELHPDPVAARALLALPPSPVPDSGSEHPRSANALWLTLDEAEDYTGLPVSILRDLIEAQALRAMDVGVRPGGRFRVRRVDLDQIEGKYLTSRF
jgi:hypothetical protein